MSGMEGLSYSSCSGLSKSISYSGIMNRDFTMFTAMFCYSSVVMVIRGIFLGYRLGDYDGIEVGDCVAIGDSDSSFFNVDNCIFTSGYSQTTVVFGSCYSLTIVVFGSYSLTTVVIGTFLVFFSNYSLTF